MPDLPDGWALGCSVLSIRVLPDSQELAICALTIYKRGLVASDIYIHPELDGCPCLSVPNGFVFTEDRLLSTVIPCIHHFDELLIIVDAANRSGRKIAFCSGRAWLAEERA
jgi:hypothetical protein